MNNIHAMIILALFGFVLVYAGFYYQQDRNSKPIPVLIVEKNDGQ